MRRFYILCLFFSICLNLYGQKIKDVKIQSKTLENQFYVILSGKSSLPTNTSLKIQIFFYSTPVSTHRLCKVQNGYFTCAYGPLYGKVLKGEYIARIYSIDFCIFEEKFFYGTPLAIVQKKREYYYFIEKSVSEIQKIFIDLKTKTEEGFEKKAKDSQEIELWILKQQKQIENLTADCTQRFPNQVLASYAQNDTIKDFNSALMVLDSFWQICFFLLSKQYGFSIPEEMVKKITKARYAILSQSPMDVTERKEEKEKDDEIIEKYIALLSQNFASTTQEYYRGMLQNCQGILSREAIPKNLNESHLEEDIKIFNEIYKKFVLSYRKQKARGQKQEWENSVRLLKMEMAAFEDRIKDYKQSPMPEKYPEMIPGLQNLAKCSHSLESSYTKDLYPESSSGVKFTKEEAELKLREEFSHIYRIIENYKEKIRQEKQKVLEELVKLHTHLQKFSEEFYKNWKKIKEIPEEKAKIAPREEWFKEWNATSASYFEKIKAMQKDSSFQNHFADIFRPLYSASMEFLNIATMYQKYRGNSSSELAYLYHYKRMKKALSQAQERLTEEQK